MTLTLNPRSPGNRSLLHLLKLSSLIWKKIQVYYLIYLLTLKSRPRSCNNATTVTDTEAAVDVSDINFDDDFDQPMEVASSAKENKENLSKAAKAK